MFRILVTAGLGGTLPTLCRLAAAYNAGSDPPFGPGVCIALGLFFVIGMAVAFGLGESEVKKAFVLGIAGPAIVTSTFNAASQGKSVVPVTVPAAAALRDAHRDSLVRLLGIADANAQPEQSRRLTQAQSFASEDRARLRVTTNLGKAAAGFAIDPVGLRFLSDNKVVLESTSLDARFPATVTVPAGARSVAAVIDGQVATANLPSGLFTYATLTLNIDTSHLSDFLWALGSNRRVRVEGVSASIGNVVQQPQAAAPEPHAATRSISAEPPALTVGTRVYSESGAPVGVIESIKPATAGKAAQIVIRPDESPPR